MRHFPLIGAVRHVLIENPAALSTPPTAAVRVPRVNYGFALGALDRIAYYFEGSRGGTEDIATIRAALTAALDPQVKK